jgi:hypothetical protein
MSDEQASLQSVRVDHYVSTDQRVDAMVNLDFSSNTRETVLFGIYEALGTPIPPWRAQPSRR